MKIYNIGETLRMLRRHKKITQAKLADGIMSTGQLSRIECGTKGVDKETMDLLFNRLGYVAGYFSPFPMTETLFRVYLLRDELKTYLSTFDKMKTEELLAEMERMPEFESGILRQSLLSGKAALCLNHDNDTRHAMELLNEAIKITIPTFEKKLTNTYLLGKGDIDVINLMAQALYTDGEHDEAINLLKKLVENINKRFSDMHEKARSLTFVAYNLTCYLGRAGRHKEALKLCNEAIEAGETHRAYGFLPVLKYNKAYLLQELGLHDEVADLVYQAYYGSLALGEKFYAVKIKESAEEDFSILLK